MNYAELRCKTNFSFLKGASHPHELIERAAALGFQAIAITDLNGVYGIPRAFRAIQAYPHLKLIVGSELVIIGAPSITLLAQDREGYARLCRAITAAHKTKDEVGLFWEEFCSLMVESAGLLALAEPSQHCDWQKLRHLFPSRIFVTLSRFLDGMDDERTRAALLIRDTFGIPIVATNDVYYHAPERRCLQDVLTAIREHTTVEGAGKKLLSNTERHLKSGTEMATLFRDLPEAIENTMRIAESCTFSPAELRYRYPSEWIPKGLTSDEFLAQLVSRGVKRRYPQGVPSDVQRQLEHELKLIRELSFADYFLTLWEIVEFARSRKILCQGRGSAANSAVCFCLGLTAIDPVRMNLLFERFISAERGEPPDIDVDFEHERREEVLQHVYEKYGRHRAGMVSVVITYQRRSARRDVEKALGESVAKVRADLVESLSEEIADFPRHLSIHPGGFTLSKDPLAEIVPIEPARMPGRTIIQWDKEDLDILGLLKVDLLGLGILTVLHRTLDLVGKFTLATIPPEDPKTYAMIQKSDTVGVFQIESRAQMSMLPRLQPKTFYDLVIEVAIVRPGPIVGQMIHPYLRRKRGLEKAVYPDPRLYSILGRTLGVPLFQEQVMKMAVALAGFTPGEADELRRAIGAWRSSGSIHKVGKRLMEGLLRNGIPKSYADQVFEQLKGFAEYGFPESHAASFALLAYASAYLRCHYPTEYLSAMINSQPMGFYSIHTLVDDGKRHGVTVLPVDLNQSVWDCVIEKNKLRLGWRVVRGMGEKMAARLEKVRREKPFQNMLDFLIRSELPPQVLHRLAMGDAFRIFNFDQRDALWEVLAYELVGRPKKGQLSLFPYFRQSVGERLFPSLDHFQAISEDYASYQLSLRGHPMSGLRDRMPGLPKLKSAEAKQKPRGARVTVAGAVIVRQRPPTAKGTVFATLEDEAGFLDLILHAKIYEKFQDIFSTHAFIIVSGRIQRDALSVNLLVDDLRTIWANQDPSEEMHHSVRSWH